MADAAEAPKKGSTLKKVLMGIAAMVAIFLVVVAMQPNEYTVTRTATIAAPASAVFPLVNDLHQWEKWSPWDKVDPAMKRTFEGPPSGVNAVYGWTGNSEVGEGKMTITESKAPELIRIRLDFFKPMEGTSDTVFAFKENAGKTDVTWTMSGKNNFVAKAMCMFMNMDKMVGGMFEKGLADLKTQSEAKK